MHVVLTMTHPGELQQRKRCSKMQRQVACIIVALFAQKRHNVVTIQKCLTICDARKPGIAQMPRSGNLAFNSHEQKRVATVCSSIAENLFVPQQSDQPQRDLSMIAALSRKLAIGLKSADFKPSGQNNRMGREAGVWGQTTSPRFPT